MRYVVKDPKGKWQASYSKLIPSYSQKEILKWAKQTAKHCGGAVYEVIEPSSPQYPIKEVKLFDFSYNKATHLRNYDKSKEHKSIHKKEPSNKKNTSKENKKKDKKE
jgi:hypothetical protein